MTAPDPSQIQQVSTPLVLVITAIIGVLGSVAVAYIARGGNRRTEQTSKVPDTIAIMREEIADLKGQRDRANTRVDDVQNRLNDLQDNYIRQLGAYADDIFPPEDDGNTL